MHVSAIIHKAVLIVNEEGAEAAAVTAVVISRSMAIRQDPLVFAVDRPFVFAIVDSELSAVLFCGRIVHPKFDA